MQKHQNAYGVTNTDNLRIASPATRYGNMKIISLPPEVL